MTSLLHPSSPALRPGVLRPWLATALAVATLVAVAQLGSLRLALVVLAVTLPIAIVCLAYSTWVDYRQAHVRHAAVTEWRQPWNLPLLAGSILLVTGLVGPRTTAQIASTLLSLIFLFFLGRHLIFVVASADRAGRELSAAALAVIPDETLPSVTVLVPCRDEELVVEGLVASLLALDYPADKLQVIVINDGSIDRTGELLDAAAGRDARLRPLHRPRDAGGGKSGALNNALPLVSSDVVVVFDADHQPAPDAVRRLARHFADPMVGAVQGRCVIRNADDSLLARAVALDYQCGYLINEYGRQAVYALPAYGGANCAVRTDVLTADGGWNEKSVTEDTDITLRVLLRGLRVHFDVTAVDTEQAVTTLRRYWKQRYRWARGHQEVWRDYRSAVWRSPHLGWGGKLETMMFLLVFHVPVLCFAGLILVLLGVIYDLPSSSINLFPLATLLFIGPMVELGASMLVARNARRDVWTLMLFIPTYVVSMTVCAKAWLDGLLGSTYSWQKTKRVATVTKQPTALVTAQ